jgi:copper resistance protein B
MKIRLQVLILTVAVGLLFTVSSSAQDDHRNMPMPKQTPTPKASPTPTEMPMMTPTPTPTPTAQPTPMDMDMHRNMPMPSPTPPKPAPSPAGGRNETLGNLSPEKDFPEPVADNERFGMTLFDVLEFRPGRGGESGDFRWDIEGWYGTDKNRFYYKSEGERNTAFKAEYDIDLQLLYGRMISPYFDFQVGVRFETHSFRGANVTRPQAVVGLEGLLPYFIELESGVFIDPKGNVSGRASLTKDFLFTNRWIVQARFETNAAIQRVERFSVGKGLNNIEAGFRLRYEFSRRFAPYVGVSFERSFFGTADLVRSEGGDPKQIRLVTGVRLLF